MKVRKRAALALAEKVALCSDHKTHKLGCVLVDRRDNLLSVGHNTYKTHPTQKKYATEDKKHLHAEVSALIKADGVPYKAYIVRTTKSGGTGMAKPCEYCMAALLESGVPENNIYWST